jgi:hypothetical protein
MRAKMNRYGTFLTLLDRFKNHIFYERKRLKKLALLLTDVKIVPILKDKFHKTSLEARIQDYKVKKRVA